MEKVKCKTCTEVWLDVPGFENIPEKEAIQSCVCQLLEEAPVGGRYQLTIRPVKNVEGKVGQHSVTVDMFYYEEV